MNEGARQLAASGVSLGEIAKACGTAKPVVSRWRSGQAAPSPKFRRLLERSYGIASPAWDEPAGTSRPGKPPASSGSPPSGPLAGDPVAPAVTTPEGAPEALDHIDQLTSMLGGIRAARSRPDVGATELARLMASEGTLIERIARLEAQRRAEIELLESRIVREHPAWQRLRDAVLDALRPFPDAARAVLTAVQSIEAA